jgi:hypothetical protein
VTGEWSDPEISEGFGWTQKPKSLRLNHSTDFDGLREFVDLAPSLLEFPQVTL